MKRILAIISCLMLTSCVINKPCNGKKIGRIVKLAEEGVFCKTMEGELIRGGIVDGSGSMGTSIKFTIENEHLKEIALEAFENQIEVVLVYEVEFCSKIWRSECDTPHFVKKIEFMR